MVAKFKTSFFKNSFQIFCHKHLMPKDVVHNTTTNPLTDESKKLSNSSSDLNHQIEASSNGTGRLSKKDKNLLKIIHNNSIKSTSYETHTSNKDSHHNSNNHHVTTRSSSLNYKHNSINGPSITTNKKNYVTINGKEYHTYENGKIKTSNSHSNFQSNETNNSPNHRFTAESQQSGVHNSPTHLKKDSPTNRNSVVLPISNKSSPSSDQDLIMLPESLSELANDNHDLPDVVYVSYKKRSKSNNNEKNQFSAVAASSNVIANDSSPQTARSNPAQTLLSNGAIFIDPPSLNRAVNINRYSMPNIPSPVLANGRETHAEYVDFIEDSRVTENANTNHSSDFFLAEKKNYAPTSLYHNHSIAYLKQLKLAKKQNTNLSPKTVSHAPPNSIKFNSKNQTNSNHEHPHHPHKHPHTSRNVESAPSIKRSLKSSIFSRGSNNNNKFNEKPYGGSNKPRSMSVNSKKVVRFADSLGLELEHFIPFSHGNKATHVPSHHYQYYQHNPIELMNPSSKSKITPNHDGHVNYAYFNARNNYLNKAHSNLVNKDTNGVNGVKNDVYSTNSNSNYANNNISNGVYANTNGTINFYDGVMNQLNGKTVNSNGNDSNYDMLKQQKMHPVNLGNNSPPQNYLHVNGNEAVSEKVNESRSQHYALQFKSQQVNGHVNNKSSNGNSTKINNGQNITITTRINNGKLESEV